MASFMSYLQGADARASGFHARAATPRTVPHRGGRTQTLRSAPMRCKRSHASAGAAAAPSSGRGISRNRTGGHGKSTQSGGFSQLSRNVRRKEPIPIGASWARGRAKGAQARRAAEAGYRPSPGSPGTAGPWRISPQAAQRSIRPLQPAEARMVYWDRLQERDRGMTESNTFPFFIHM